jgi:hypothetical protein
MSGSGGPPPQAVIAEAIHVASASIAQLDEFGPLEVGADFSDARAGLLTALNEIANQVSRGHLTNDEAREALHGLIEQQNTFATMAGEAQLPPDVKTKISTIAFVFAQTLAVAGLVMHPDYKPPKGFP